MRPGDWPWVEPLPPLELADGSGRARRQTRIRLLHDLRALYVSFDCEGSAPQATLTQRDDPLWQEDVVEVFLAPGAGQPVHYHEFEVNPLGALFDAAVHNPDSRRETLRVDASWDCPGVRWTASLTPSGWWAALELPWAGLLTDAPRPTVWRGNFFRIDRPAEGAAEFSCWSSTHTRPADFHRPASFGVLRIDP
jgi:hypothetical protein